MASRVVKWHNVNASQSGINVPISTLGWLTVDRHDQDSMSWCKIIIFKYWIWGSF